MAVLLVITSYFLHVRGAIIGNAIRVTSCAGHASRMGDKRCVQNSGRMRAAGENAWKADIEGRIVLK